MAAVHKARSAWEDRFRQPTVADLLGGMPKEVASLVRAVRGELHEGRELTEELRWLGVSWCWTMVFRAEEANPKGWVYLIPRPDRPCVAVPVSVHVLESVPLRNFGKVVRDGLQFSRVVDGVRWPEWELTSKSMAEEIVKLAEHTLHDGRRDAIVAHGPRVGAGA